MVRAGAALTRKLDDLGWPLVASLWLYVTETNSWKLVLASPLVASAGPKQAYETVQTALAEVAAEADGLTLSDIGVTEPHNPLLKLLRVAIDTGPAIGAVRFTKNVINGQFIEDAYIYRMTTRVPGTEGR